MSYFDPADTSGNHNRIFATNAAGQVLTAVNGSAHYSSNNTWLFEPILTHYEGAGWSTGQAQLYRYANGQYLGTLGTLQTGFFKANFDTNFEPISSNYPAPVPSQVTIQSGDTLRSIATRIFGDGNLWYVLADANGLTDGPDALLNGKVGWSLRVPNEVISMSNNGSSFKPFSVGDALGDTTPIQPAPPPPKAGGCGILGQIIVIIVAIVVTYFTAGAASEVMSPMVAAAFGAAVGSVASQVVGIALGVQEKFSWKAVAVAALTAGITKGIGVDDLSLIGKSADSIVNQAINGAISNAIGQGISIAVGLQDKFSWRDLAISAVSAPIANRIGTAVGKRIDPLFGLEGHTNKFMANFTSGAVAGMSSVAVRMALGGKVDTQTVLGDVFGNALGNSIVDSIAASGNEQIAEAEHDRETAENFLKEFNAKNPNFAERMFPLSAADSASTEVTSAGNSSRDVNLIPAGSTISHLVRSSDPTRIGLFMMENGLSSSAIRAGDSYVNPGGNDRYSAEELSQAMALGQATLDNDNSRVAANAAFDRWWKSGLDSRAVYDAYSTAAFGQMVRNATVPVPEFDVSPDQWIGFPMMSGWDAYAQMTAQGVPDIVGAAKDINRAMNSPTANVIFGSAKAAGGAVEMWGGSLLEGAPIVGQIFGTVVILHGADVLQSGVNQIRTMEHYDDFTVRGLTPLIGSTGANVVDSGFSLLAGGGLPVLKSAGILDEMMTAGSFVGRELAPLPETLSIGSDFARMRGVQSAVDRAVADLAANPGIARDIMSEGSYRHLVERTGLADASYGKAVERIAALHVADNPSYANMLSYQSRPFRSTPDFFGYEGYNLHLFDITTAKGIPTHLTRSYGPATEFILHPGLPKNLVFPR